MVGPWHSGEEVYCYGNIPENSKLYDARDRELSGQMLPYWKNFCAGGDPNDKELPDWDQNQTSASLMEFGSVTGMTQEKKLELYGILDRMDGFSG